MDSAQKHQLSHRGRAMRRAKDQWGALIAAEAPGFP
jgi:inosine/xanthosine triphosphate pyrophosphatase family protein